MTTWLTDIPTACHFTISFFFFDWLYSPCGPLPLFSFLIYLQSIRFLARVISPSQGLYLNTEKHIYTANIHAVNGIRTHDHRVRASEDISCLRPLSYRDRLSFNYA
jgi:hypothetical protein